MRTTVIVGAALFLTLAVQPAAAGSEREHESNDAEKEIRCVIIKKVVDGDGQGDGREVVFNGTGEECRDAGRLLVHLGDEDAIVVSGDDKKRIKDVQRVVIGGGAGGGFLGVGVAEIDAERARERGLREEAGVEVKSVVDDSPAAKAGVRVGDVVIEYNGQRVIGTAQFVRLVRETPPGRSVRLIVSRDGTAETLTATIGEPSARKLRLRGKDGGETEIDIDIPGGSEPFIWKMDPSEMPEIKLPDLRSLAWGAWGTPRLGVETDGLGPQLAEYFGVKEGVLVRSVMKDSAAERAGLKAGDVIVRLAGEKIARPGDLTSALAAQPAGEPFRITIVRGGREQVLTATLDERRGETRKPIRRKAVRIGGGGDEL